jgi:uncharacterized membrane protein
MKSEILVIAEAILANIHVLEMLVAKLPDESATKVKEIVATQVTPVAAPVAEVKKPIEVEIPVLVPPKAEVVAPIPVAVAPAPTINLVPMPAAPAPVTASPSDCPIKDGKGLMEFLMGAYKSNPTLGAKIQDVLKSIGCEAVNEVRPDQYQVIHEKVTALFLGQ